MDPEQVVHLEILRIVEHLQSELRDVRQRATLVLIALAFMAGSVVPGTVSLSHGNLGGWAVVGVVAGAVCLILLMTAMGPGLGTSFVTDPHALARDAADGDVRKALTDDLAGRTAQFSTAVHARRQALQGAVLLLGISTVAWLIALGKL